VKLEAAGEAEGFENVDGGEIDYNVAVGFVANGVHNLVEFGAGIGFGGQFDEEDIVGIILYSHFCSPSCTLAREGGS